METVNKLANVPAFMEFRETKDEKSFELFQRSVLSDGSAHVVQNSAFVKELYNFIRSPSLDVSKPLFLKCVQLCIECCARLQPLEVKDHRTSMFICRKSGWILLKEAKGELRESVLQAAEIGRKAAVWLLGNNMSSPNVSLVGEVHKSLFEIELAKVLSSLFQGASNHLQIFPLKV